MADVKVRVLDATVGGAKKGDIISVPEKTADHLESIRYVARVGAKKAADKKEEGNEDDK